MSRLKIKIKPLFILYVFLCIYFGWFNKIFYYVIAVALHEYGHYLDSDKQTGNCEELSSNIELHKIFEEEKYNFKVDHSNPEYFMNNIQEYFAQAYSEYLTNPRRLKKHCPKTYEFIRYHIDGQYVEVEAM